MGDDDKKERYKQLTLLDDKCNILLQVCAVMAALLSIPATVSTASPWVRGIAAVAILTFLAVSFKAVSVIRVDWDPTSEDVKRRTGSYNQCRNGVKLGLILSGLFVVVALIASIV